MARGVGEVEMVSVSEREEGTDYPPSLPFL